MLGGCDLCVLSRFFFFFFKQQPQQVLDTNFLETVKNSQQIS